MTVEELLKVKPSTFGVTYLALKGGKPLIVALRETGIPIDLEGHITIQHLRGALVALNDEERAKALQWEIDTETTVPALGRKQMAIDEDRAVNHVNTVYGWTTCLTTLMLVGAISWNIVMIGEYPNPWLMLIILFPITIATIWLLGILKGRQSLLGVVLGEGEAKEGIVQAAIKGVINRK
ncbi:hypothetical protein SPLA10_PHROGS00055 [Salmonella phage SPLA10]|nr:hypothetical protein SPLA10_PHROGS00055 [Salmonella phage SPLA10]